MPKFEVNYSCYLNIEVEAENENEANDIADNIINNMTGADFRDSLEWDDIMGIKNA